MKVSDITTKDLKDYVRAYDEINLDVFLSAAKSYIKGQTGLTDIEMDQHEDLVPVVYVLVADMYDNRQYASENRTSNINVVAKTTLDMYCKNLL